MKIGTHAEISECVSLPGDYDADMKYLIVNDEGDV